MSKGDEEAGTKGDAVARNPESRTGAVEVAGSLVSTDAAEAGTGAVEVAGSLGGGGGEDEKPDGCSTHTS